MENFGCAFIAIGLYKILEHLTQVEDWSTGKSLINIAIGIAIVFISQYRKIA
jgi:hypothetical protein